MIFKKMILNNFRPYYTDNKFQEIEFSSGEKNVTLIKAENGTGKTTLLEAFKWCFYGEKLNLPSPNIFLNEKAFAELTPGDSTTVGVTIEFEENGYLYKIIRNTSRGKNSTGNEKPEGSTFSLINISEEITYTGKNAEDKIRELLPQDLNFFFDGERLTQMEGKTEKKGEIISVLGIKAFENAKKDLNRVIKKYEEKINLSEGENKEYNDLLIKRKKIENDKNFNIKEIKEKMVQFEGTKDAKNKLEIKLEEIRITISNKGEIGKELGEAQKEKENLKKRSEEAHVKYKQKMSKNASLILGKGIIVEGFNILEEARSKGKIPSNVRETLIDDLLKLETCICGRHIGEKERESLNSLRKNATDEELEQIFNSVYQRLKKDASIARIEKKEEISQLKKKCLEIEKKYKETSELVDNLSNQFKEEDEENIERRDSFEQTKSDYDRLLGRLESDINTLRSKSKELDSNWTSIENKINSKKLKITSEGFKKGKDMTLEISKVVNKLYELKLIRENKKLNEKIKKIYSKVTRKGYFIELTQNFELKVYKDKYKNIEVALSTGENKMVVLCFIGALVDLARKLNKVKNELDISGGIYPIVLDSPYGDLDVEHKREMTIVIQELSDQIILFASSSQWSSDVEELMKDRVGNVYELKNKNRKNSNEIHEYTIISKVGE